MDKLVYVDNAGTTPLSRTALDAMMPFLTHEFGNASAVYGLGRQAKKAREDSRRKMASLLGARENEIFFTSGGTESDNWALHRAAELRSDKGKHIITTAIEHSAVLHTTEKLETMGYELSYLPVNKEGQITVDQLKSALRPDTIVVSIMLANNEIGTILPIKELCQATKEYNRRIIFHTDAVQAVGHIPLDVRDLGVDLLSLSAHKFNGPKGIGALYMRIGTALAPYLTGGGQEKGRRSGTDNVPGIVGMAAALEETVERLPVAEPAVAALRDKLVEGVLGIPGSYLTGDPMNRLPGSASFIFDDLAYQPLIKRLDDYGICASQGSACSAGSGDPSRVLTACGYSEEHARASLRMTLSAQNTESEIAYVIDTLALVVAELRNAGPAIYKAADLPESFTDIKYQLIS